MPVGLGVWERYDEQEGVLSGNNGNCVSQRKTFHEIISWFIVIATLGSSELGTRIQSHLFEHRASIGHWDQGPVLQMTGRCCETISLHASCLQDSIKPGEAMCRGVLRGSTLAGAILGRTSSFSSIYAVL